MGKYKNFNCKTCKKKLSPLNKCGYCLNCYLKTPDWKKYMREQQKEWYSKPVNKLKKHKYNTSEKSRKRNKKYMKVYVRENLEHIRELKRDWARKNRKENKK